MSNKSGDRIKEQLIEANQAGGQWGKEVWALLISTHESFCPMSNFPLCGKTYYIRSALWFSFKIIKYLSNTAIGEYSVLLPEDGYVYEHLYLGGKLLAEYTMQTAHSYTGGLWLGAIRALSFPSR